MMWWWLLPVWAAAFCALFFGLRYYYKKKAKSPRNVVKLAHTDNLKHLPSYQKVLAHYRLWRVILIVATAMAIASFVFVSLRPIDTALVEPEQKNRDIMLCLDVSGSVIPSDYEIFTKMLELVDKFDGQRVGLMTFNSSAATVFPLTDDYDLVKEYLGYGQELFKDVTVNDSSSMLEGDVYEGGQYAAIMSGTTAAWDGSDRASASGDGLASCISHMGGNDQKRAQSIIFATDNEHWEQVFSVTESAAMAKQKGIRVYALDPGVDWTLSGATPETNPDHVELRKAALATDGKYYELESLSISNVISDISRQEATFFAGSPTLSRSDSPLIFAIVAGFATIVSAVAIWRLKT